MAKIINTTENIAKGEIGAKKCSRAAEHMMDAEERVWIKIPTDHVSGDDAVEVGINGVLFRIRRGVSVEVPYPIYRILEESGKYDL